MKKDRNTIFSEAGFSNQSYMPNMNPYGPYQASEASQSFYSGQYPMNQMNNTYSDLDNRLMKIERQINRLDARISKLESTSGDSDNYSSSMYIV